MPKGVYDRRDLSGACKNCGRTLPWNGLRFQRSRRQFCESCKRIRVRRQQAESASRRKREPAPESSYLVVGEAFRRQQADAALDSAPHKRHCSCGQWYLMACFTSPCPYCGDALDPHPGGPYDC